MVRYKSRYALVFVEPPLNVNGDKLQHIIREHVIDLFGIVYSEMAQSLQIIYYHPYTGTLIIRTRLMFIKHLRVAMVYLNKFMNHSFEATIMHTSATVKQIGKIFEGKIRQFILYNSSNCDLDKLAKAVAEIMESMEQLKIEK
eukprot:NODE_531_length_7106_cov_0.213929.p5 type:complete len:143 gc:universal NODE_531_length_7106_cov_0.213929:6206-6634(+)